MPELLNHGDFTLHSGGHADLKIDCDVLSDTDIEALAAYAVLRLPPYCVVEGVPRGGQRLADALARRLPPQIKHSRHSLLIVDDVLTTGASMEQYRYLLYGQPNAPYKHFDEVTSCARRVISRRTSRHTHGKGAW